MNKPVKLRKGESLNEHYENTNLAIHDRLAKYFFISDKQGDVDQMMKLSSQIGYIQQIHVGLNKNLLVEKEITNIKKRLDRIPPEILEQYVTNPELIIPAQ